MITDAVAELPQYQCHKIVHALKLVGVYHLASDEWLLVPDDRFTHAPFKAPEGWAGRFRGSETDPGYYVVYEDGYISWSPTETFESGYSRIYS